MNAIYDPLFGALMGDQWFPSPAHVMRRAAIMDAFSHYPAGKLLEMGCGAGRMLADWSRLGHSGLAVDLDPTARELARRCVNAYNLDFTIRETVETNEAFDYLVSTEVLEHVDEPGALLQQWADHLKKDGIFLATVPAFQKLWGTSDEWAGHVRRFEPQAFRALVEEAGLTVLSMRLYGYPIGNMLRYAGNYTSGLKMRRSAEQLSRSDATLASGHDRSVEAKLAPLMRSMPSRMVLRSANALQRRFPSHGHGLIVLAQKGDRSALNHGT